MRFEKNSDCYLDTKTGLGWSLENYDRMTWQKAMDFCSGLNEGWKLPTVEELFSLTVTDFTKSDTVTTLPDIIADNYWSSSTSAFDPDDAWYVDFYYGGVGDYRKTFHNYARCVRGNTI